MNRRNLKLAILVFGVVIFGITIYRRALLVSAVQIKIKDGVKEKYDPVIFGIGKQHQLPDYRVKLLLNGKLFHMDLGTHLDTSATNWITFPVAIPLSPQKIQQVLIFDDDKVLKDPLDRVFVKDNFGSGNSFECKILTERNYGEAFDRTTATVGMVVLIVVIAFLSLR